MMGIKGLVTGGALDIIAKLSNPDYLEMALMTKVGLLDGTQ